MAAVTSFHADKCCHLVSEQEASAQCLSSSVRQFLIYSILNSYLLSQTQISQNTGLQNATHTILIY